MYRRVKVTRPFSARKISYYDMTQNDIVGVRLAKKVSMKDAMIEVEREFRDAPSHEQEKLWQKVYSPKD